MDQPPMEDRAMREEHVNQLVSHAALMRIKRLVDERRDEDKSQGQVMKVCCIVAGSLVALVVALYIIDASIFSTLARCATALVR